MDCGSKNIEDDEDTATKHVLDYYKKYSQNKGLPKYFSGTPLSYLPEIKDDEFPEVTVKTDVNIVITSPSMDKVHETTERSLDTSGASSVMSNRKLEWDNGADIGYDNCQDIKILRKSISLPIITDLKQGTLDLGLRPIMSNIEQAKSEGSSDSNFKIVVLTYSSSSECPSPDVTKGYSSSTSPVEEKEKYVSSNSSSDINALSKNNAMASSTSDSSNKEKFVKFANSLSFLKKQIGLPGAHSTPKYLENRKSDPELYSSSHLTIKPKANEDNGEMQINVCKSSEDVQQTYKEKDNSGKLLGQLAKKVYSLENIPVVNNEGRKNFDKSKQHVFTYKNNKVINLAITKPVTVECTCDISSPRRKPSQTLSRCASVGIQTDKIPEGELIQIIRNTTPLLNSQNQSLIYFEFSETDKTNCSTQTSSDLASNCDSFEYHKNSSEPKTTMFSVPTSDQNKETEPLSKGSTVSAAEMPEENKNMRRSEKTSDLRTVASEENSHQSSKDFCLGNVIYANQADSVGDDVEKSINLLHKLIKSKKYDPVTKNRYIKKIVQKLTNPKYLEESSASSDLFLPKKTKMSNVKLPEPTSTDTSDDKPHKSRLQSNLPWYPAVNERMRVSPPRKKKLVVKTFAQDFLPKQNQPSGDEANSPEMIPVELRDTKKNCFTLTNNEFSANREYSYQEKIKLGGTKGLPYEMDSTELEKPHNSALPSYQNWREDKTESEKLLEEKSDASNGDGDCLVKFAEKERAHQINWINNEISHLGKLKGLLEKPIAFPNFKKTTTVYTVSEERDRSDRKQIRFQRNYVIETQLASENTKPVSFNLDGKKYTVSEQPSKKTHSSKKSKQVVGDIEVTTSDSTTSIKITTFCESCRKSPCTCVCSKCKKDPCSCNMTKTRVCRVCRIIPCMCQGTSSGKHHTNCLLEQNVCWKCNKSPCECARPSSAASTSASTLSGKTICLLCHRSPCACSSKWSGRGLLSKTCLSCGQYPCVRGKSKVSTESGVSDEYTGAYIPALPPKPTVECENQQKFATFPYTSRDDYGKKISFKCPVCEKRSCTCGSLRKDFYTQGTSISFKLLEESTVKKCSICGESLCVCATPKTSIKLSRKCSVCGKLPCICGLLKVSISLKNCPACGISPCTCGMNKNFHTKGTSVSIKSVQMCSVCGKCPCICVDSNDSLEKCTTCAITPCVCEALKKDFHTQGTSVSTKSLGFCSVCGKCPCICQKIKKDFESKSTSISKKTLGLCAICSRSPCVCSTFRKDFDTKGTSVSINSLEVCSVCNIYPCTCGIPRKDFDTKGTSVSRKSLGMCSICGKSPCTCDTLRSALSVKDSPEKGTSSLRKVFENCNCTEAVCSCDFVENLIRRFNKADVPSSTRPRDIYTCTLSDLESKISQTEGFCQNVAIQTQAEVRHQVLQTSKNSSDSEQQYQPKVNSADGLTQVEITKCDEAVEAKQNNSAKSTSFSKHKVNTECSCDCVQGTQTLSTKKVLVKFPSQSDCCSTTGSLQCTCNPTEIAGISHVKKPGKTPVTTDKYCICNYENSSKRQPHTIVTKQYESKSESLESDTKYMMSSKSSSAVASSFNGTESVSELSSLITCTCCKEKHPPENISMLGSANQTIPLCVHCLQRRPILTSLCYAGPEHVCSCYKPVRGDILHGIKETVEELYDLEDFCSCTKPTLSKNSKYCTYCQLKLKSTAKTKNGIAYTLTLENESPQKVKHRRKRKKPFLEEIRVKVPCPHSRKEHKDKVNLSRQDGDKESVHTVGYMERVLKEGEKRTPRVKVICSKTKRSRRPNLTLQEYLRKNRPDFIDNAQYRREALLTSKSERELNREEVKLRLLDENKCRCNMRLENNKCRCSKLKDQNNKLFTESEMKAITRRNYAKLPEVQQRNNEIREQKLRNADKFIVDVFSTKIRKCALKGKRDFPLSKNIVSLPQA